MHEWKAGDVAYVAGTGWRDGERVVAIGVTVLKVGKALWLEERLVALRGRERVDPNEVHPTRKAALEAFARAQADHAEQCEAEARKLRALAEDARTMAEEEP